MTKYFLCFKWLLLEAWFWDHINFIKVSNNPKFSKGHTQLIPQDYDSHSLTLPGSSDALTKVRWRHFSCFAHLEKVGVDRNKGSVGSSEMHDGVTVQRKDFLVRIS